MTPRKLAVESKSQHKEPSQLSGNGGELHQLATGTRPPFTTQTGAIIAVDENSLNAGCWTRQLRGDSPVPPGVSADLASHKANLHPNTSG